MKILVVDDEQDICDILRFNLETEGYEVDIANSAEEALQLPLQAYDMLLLDVMMGEMSGFQLARQLRSQPATQHLPIIFITALDDENDIIKGLNIGADDYIAKPLSVREVKARVRAVLRRTQHNRVGEQPTIEQTAKPSRRADIAYETLLMNTESKMVYIDNEEVQLTKLEFALLRMLLKHPGKVYSRECILNEIWPGDAIVMDRTVDVNITRLRKKIGRYGKHIKTRFGYGYSFEE